MSFTTYEDVYSKAWKQREAATIAVIIQSAPWSLARNKTHQQQHILKEGKLLLHGMRYYFDSIKSKTGTSRSFSCIAI